MRYTLAQRHERALELRRNGKNCAQCVSAVFDDIENIPDASTMMRLTAPFGGGIGGQGLTCGALTSQLMIASFIAPIDTPKPTIYAETRNLTSEFVTRHGAIECRRLKGELKVPCEQLILQSITALHNLLAGEK